MQQSVVPNGISAFPITPTDRSGHVDAPALRRLVARLCAAEIPSIGLLGSTGAYPFISPAERRRALEASLEEASGRTPIVVGIGSLRTDEAVQIARDAKAAGATAGLLPALSYAPLSEEEVFEHFAAVAREGGLPLCIYDNPSTTHFRFTRALMTRLSRLPGVVALKYPAPEPTNVAAHLKELRSLVPEGFSVGSSVDWFSVEAMLAGVDVWHSVAAGLFPQASMAILRAVRRGDAAGARCLDAKLGPLWRLFRELSSFRVAYACANLLGLSGASPPRPVLPVAGRDLQRISDVLSRLELA